MKDYIRTNVVCEKKMQVLAQIVNKALSVSLISV